MKDYYKILDLESNATPAQIKEQHRIMIHAWHPDKFPDGDLKTKANEKASDINEAYSVLGNPVKRREYDLLFREIQSVQKQESRDKTSRQHSANSSTRSKTPSQENTPWDWSSDYSHTQDQSQSQSKTPNQQQKFAYCQSCGLPAEVKYVEFYETIGLIFGRLSRNAKGDFCKPCINHYFWNFTGRTFLLGWWGMVSLILTPFILLNNIFRFLSSLGMMKPRSSRTPNPSPFWVFISVVGMVYTAYFLTFALVGSASSYSAPPIPIRATQTNIPVSTATRKPPTRVPAKVKTEAPSYGCIKWSKVTSSMAGQTKCVYGKIYKTKWIGNNFQMLFSSDLTDFFLATGTYYYKDSEVIGNCYYVKGKILTATNGAPYINPGDFLYGCTTSMK